MTTKDDSHVFDTGRGQRLMAVGGLLGAVAASSCCTLPLVLFGLGVSGAWIGNLTQLAPYQPGFIAATLACLGCGYWLLYRSSKVSGYWLLYRSSKVTCTDGEACARPLPRRFVKVTLVVATALVIVAFGFDLIAPLLLAS